jgi:hypothetical protein
MVEGRKLIEVLKAELTFLEEGGYRARRRYPWRPNFVFEDSPTCINFKSLDERRPCTECPLIDFVPEDRREARYPCRHILLTTRGETVNSFYSMSGAQKRNSKRPCGNGCGRRFVNSRWAKRPRPRAPHKLLRPRTNWGFSKRQKLAPLPICGAAQPVCACISQPR